MNIKTFIFLASVWSAVAGASTLCAGEPPVVAERATTETFKLRVELDSAGKLHYRPFPTPPIDKILEPSGTMILVGPYVGINFAMHSGGFTVVQNGITCCTFDKGTGIGLIAGVKGFIPLTETIDLSPRIAYEGRPGTFTSTTEPFPFFGENNQVEFLRFEDEFKASLAALSIDLLGTYTFTDFGLYGAIGPSGSIFIGKTFTKSETIPGPSGVSFKAGGTSRQITTGDLTDLSGVQLDLRGGVGVKLPISDAIFLNPEVLYSFPLSTVTTIDSWKTSGLQGTVGLLLSF